MKLFLNLTKYLRSFIEKYAQRVNLLQKRKISFIKLISNAKSSTRKRQVIKIRYYNFTYIKITIFKNLQFAFKKSTFLIYYDKKRRLYINLDAFK